MNPDTEHIAQLISGVSESLHREMHEGFASVNQRLDLIETRLDRQGSMIQTGARWTTRMNTWSERIDKLLYERDKRISDLEQRVRHLEKGNTSHDAPGASDKP